MQSLETRDFHLPIKLYITRWNLNIDDYDVALDVEEGPNDSEDANNGATTGCTNCNLTSILKVS